jgi:hypothetical protein
MLDDNIRQNLRQLLEQKFEMLLSDRKALQKLRAQIRESENQIYAIKKVLGDEDAETYFNKQPVKSPLIPRETKDGTVTHVVRLILEENPAVTSKEGIPLVKEECKRRKIRTNIERNSWNQWNTYFRTGKYRMDANAYRHRYKQEPPY